MGVSAFHPTDRPVDEKVNAVCTRGIRRYSLAVSPHRATEILYFCTMRLDNEAFPFRGQNATFVPRSSRCTTRVSPQHCNFPLVSLVHHYAADWPDSRDPSHLHFESAAALTGLTLSTFSRASFPRALFPDLHSWPQPRSRLEHPTIRDFHRFVRCYDRQ